MIYLFYKLIIFYSLRFVLKTEKVSLHITAELRQTTLHQLDILILLQHQQRFPGFR